MIPVGPSVTWTSQVTTGSAAKRRLIGPRPPLPESETVGPYPTMEIEPSPLMTRHEACCPSGQRGLGAISRAFPEVPELQNTATLTVSSGPTLKVGSVIDPVPYVG